MTSEASLQAAIKSFGRVNFEVPCNIDGAPARIVMDETRVAVVTTSVVGQPPAATFGHTTATHEPGSSDVRIELADATFVATFAEQAQAERLVRVLGVRNQVELTRNGELDVPIRIVSPSFGGRRAPANEYEEWAEHTMTASTVLFIVAGLSVMLGLGVAAVTATAGHGAVALVWVLVAAAGGAMPVCLGALARTVVLRFRMEDQQR